MRAHRLAAGTIWEGDFLTAPIEPGHTLAILDGPYGLGKAAWDRVSLDALPEWYAPHLARVSSLLAPSASLYVWNTAEGWARLDPGIRALGWTFRALITWDKGNPASLVGWRTAQTWITSTEVCGFYQRNRPVFSVTECSTNVWAFSASALAKERLPSAGAIPRESGSLPGRIGNEGVALHSCQKPLAFAERMIRASTRPGERVLVPFGGTCREAVICEWLARSEPEQARGFDVCEINQDPGVDYIAPVLAQIRGEDPRQQAAGQIRLFGPTASQ